MTAVGFGLIVMDLPWSAVLSAFDALPPTLLVFLGAGIGGVMRHVVSVVGLRLLGPDFPFHTLAVNVVGSLAMGAVMAWLAARAGPGVLAARLFAATGVLGGFTTFSAFSLDAVALWEQGKVGAAALYVAASVGLSLGALTLGLWLGRP